MNSEHQEQKDLLQWWALYSKTKGIDERLLFAIPNAGKRSYKTAAMMRAEGMRSGVPDLFLALSRCQKRGLFVEMKKKKGGVVSDTQGEYIELLNGVGFLAVVCKGFEAAKDLICAYVDGTL